MSVKIIKDRAKWSDEARFHFITAMVTETERGICVDSGFKKVAWQRIVDDLNEQCRGTYTKQQCQSFYPKLKADWTAYSAIVGNSGFGVDPDTLAPTAPKSVWDLLILAHPLAAQFRNKALKNFAELDIIFNGSGATGKYAKSPFTPVTPRHKHGNDLWGKSSNEEVDRVSKVARKSPPISAQPQAMNSEDDETMSGDDSAFPRQSTKVSAMKLNRGYYEDTCACACFDIIANFLRIYQLMQWTSYRQPRRLLMTVAQAMMKMGRAHYLGRNKCQLSHCRSRLKLGSQERMHKKKLSSYSEKLCLTRKSW